MRLRRIRAEERRQDPCADLRWQPLDEECTTLVCPALPSVSVRPSEAYPFTAPSLHAPYAYRELTLWQWVAARARRASNRRFLPSPAQCLCCSSPLCKWHTQRRISDLFEYAACMHDVAACDRVACPAWVTLLPVDVLGFILDFIAEEG